MKKQSQLNFAGPASGDGLDWLPKDRQQDATGYKPLMRNPTSRVGSKSGWRFLCAFAALLFITSGCTFRWHTGPAPIEVDHGNHVEVVP